jgi:hypothetical protein
MEVDDNEIYIGDKGDIPEEILSLLPDSQYSIVPTRYYSTCTSMNQYHPKNVLGVIFCDLGASGSLFVNQKIDSPVASETCDLCDLWSKSVGL